MSVRQDITINWAVSPRIIEVAAPSTELTVQDLYDTIRNKAASVEALDKDEIIDGSGKEDLGGGTSVGLTVKLLNAKVKFEDRTEPTDCDIHGGNLVALDNSVPPKAMNPIQFATNVTVTYAKSSSATITAAAAEWTQEEKDNLPSTIWDHNDRKLSSRDIESGLPGEHLSSEVQLLTHDEEVSALLNAIKGAGFSTNKESLIKIREMIDKLPRARASFSL